ncbi:DUF2291 family protein [uncultured Draconibacterium sp.]|uniref:DUF2291 family protein n=1 Tax=uncultured Draconibacterium sp. TaxID=1573823 RepID=UPI002AA7BE36|nr:DUF2291 family protein [uncultured Draconibacterium sp.]
MKKPIKYIIGVVAVLLVLLFSFKIEKLDEFKAAKTETAFNASDYAQDVWENKMPVVANDAPDLVALIELIETNKELAFAEYGKKLGISSTWYIMAKGEGVVEKVEEESLVVSLGDDKQIQLATSFIFGNAVRDASGIVSIDDFVNMTDFNNVSVALNKLVKEDVAAELRESAQLGMTLEFAGAFEINEENTDVNSIRVIPVAVKISNE